MLANPLINISYNYCISTFVWLRILIFTLFAAYICLLYVSVSMTILKYQSATTGLFPGDTGAGRDVGDVRTSVYCALSTWSLHLAYKRLHCEDNGRTYLLGQTAVKTMRGVLACWMYQIPKVCGSPASYTRSH